VLLLPFAAIVLCALAAPGPPAAPPERPPADLVGGLMIAMWNYMGWDSASTIAGEVEDASRIYPLAMLASVVVVALSYLAPVAAIGRAGLDTSAWTTGAWADAGTALMGPALGAAVVVGGMVSALGMFNALLLSYSRVPAALADDGWLPRVFGRRLAGSGAPWVAILACALAWTASLGLAFERLVLLDVMLYGASLVLEFAALVALRLREPALPRPFRVPGGMLGAVLVGVGPTLLIGLAFVKNREEALGAVSAWTLGVGLMAAGPLLYAAARRRR